MSVLILGFPLLGFLGRLLRDMFLCIAQWTYDTHHMISFNIWPAFQWVQARSWNALP